MLLLEGEENTKHVEFSLILSNVHHRVIDYGEVRPTSKMSSTCTPARDFWRSAFFHNILGNDPDLGLSEFFITVNYIELGIVIGRVRSRVGASVIIC